MCGQKTAAVERRGGEEGCSTHRQDVLGLDVPEALDVVEDEPSQRNYHQDDERDRDEQDRRPIDVRVSKRGMRSYC